MQATNTLNLGGKDNISKDLKSTEKPNFSTELTKSPVAKSASTSPLPKSKGTANKKDKEKDKEKDTKPSTSTSNASKSSKKKANKSKTTIISSNLETSSHIKGNNDSKPKRSSSRHKKKGNKDTKHGGDSAVKATGEDEIVNGLNKLKINNSNVVNKNKAKNDKDKERDRKEKHNNTNSDNLSTSQPTSNIQTISQQTDLSSIPNQGSSNIIQQQANPYMTESSDNPISYGNLQFMPLQSNVYPLFMPAQMQDGRFVFVPVTPMINGFQGQSPNPALNQSPGQSPNRNSQYGNGELNNNATNLEGQWVYPSAFVPNTMYFANGDPRFYPQQAHGSPINSDGQFYATPYMDHSQANLGHSPNGTYMTPQPIFATPMNFNFHGYNGHLPIVSSTGEFLSNGHFTGHNNHYKTHYHSSTSPTSTYSYKSSNYSLDIPSSIPEHNVLNGAGSQHFEMTKEYLDAVNEDAEKLVAELNPKDFEKERQTNLLALLRSHLAEVFPEAELHPFGSTSNGLGLANADMDLCVCFTTEVTPKVSAVEFVENFGARLLQDKTFTEIKLLTRTRIPIIKLKHNSGLASDIGFENKLALWNTRLLKTYSEIDPRLKKLVFLVKHWSKQRNINEPYLGTLSSYCYVLMVIFYLQQRQPPVLPCLQKIHVNPDNPTVIKEGGHNVYFFDNLKQLSQYWKGENNESLAELLFGFFQYYAYSFHWSRSVVSIRTGTVLTKDEKGWIKAKYSASPSTGASVADRFWLCVEDPFELDHNLGRPADRNSVYEIRGEFIRATKNLKTRDYKQVLSRLVQPYVPSNEFTNPNPYNPYLPRTNPMSRRSL